MSIEMQIVFRGMQLTIVLWTVASYVSIKQVNFNIPNGLINLSIL